MQPTMLRSLEHESPWEAYEQIRAAGRPVWDKELRGWLITDFDTCTYVLRREDIFETETSHFPGAAEIIGPRNIEMITGPVHDRLHRWMTHWLDRTSVEELRSSSVDPIARDSFSRLREPGSDLVTTVLEPFPTLVISAILGMPPGDATIHADQQRWIDTMQHYLESYGDDAESRAGAEAAAHDLRASMAPFVDSARGLDDGSILADLWRFGSKEVEGWDREAMLDQCMTLFLAGTGTVLRLLSAVVYLVLTRPDIRHVIATDDDAVSQFMEEAMRLLTPLHVRLRVANADVSVGSVLVKKGERVLPVIAAADRDPSRWSDPATFETGRRGYASHLTFGAGPRHCPGSNLARAEVASIVREMLRQRPDIELDTNAAPPVYTGLISRVIKPLHVTWSPSRADIGS